MSLIHFSCKCNYSILLHNKTPIYFAWGLLRVCAACPTPRLNQSYELRPPWEQHLGYVSRRVRNGYNNTDILESGKESTQALRGSRAAPPDLYCTLIMQRETERIEVYSSITSTLWMTMLSASLTKLTALLPQTRDCSYHVSRITLVIPPL